jgi:hypothetical protein
MEPTFQPLEPAHTPPVAAEPAETKTSGGVRRAHRTGGISGLLLVGGGVAAVSAASSDPSSAPSTTAPSGGTGTPRTHSGSTADCPNMGDDTGGSSGSGGSSTTPSTTPSTAPTPAT